jgi:8-oxo-dGTP pyrophosphatase MutT (NUDIX family)
VLPSLIRKWGERLTLRGEAPIIVPQSGAVPYTIVDGRITFLLITSRRTGRWIFPKGSAIEGLTPREVAMQEAFEEAGVEGEVHDEPIGSYRSVKVVGLRRSLIQVDLYPLRLTRQLDDWPEKAQRHRHWVLLPEAKRLLSSPQLIDIAVRLNQSVLSRN